MLQQLIVSFLASACFGILFSIPKRFLLPSGVVGMMGWGLYSWLSAMGMTMIPATLLAAFLVTSFSLLFARLYKAPVTIFSASGIVPLVPGGLAYDAMRYFVENDYNLAVQFSAKAFMISGAIAMGLILAEVLYQIGKRQTRR
ncbi:threonine/serine exporter family protein [Alicyclobacillus tolerans]|uniref:threonine/serine exporter family protein n=1 Tax=Alicyclobacillus tolerans TaxID=90970 RepID=UPI001F42E171|nr:threonine/serine exporter family protein [Alicyclobacillus tolerans]MCF8567263.1 threonine/serine exporter family protein [Alicyclobacillus tolerans]